MYYLIYLTERCNLSCAYCESLSSRERFTQDVVYPVDDLLAFLGRDDDAALQFYGGEPLLRTDLLAEIVARTEARHVVLQTNGLLLDRLAPETFAKVDAIAVSLDGPPELTDRGRGEGVYAKALAQVQALRAKGYAGRLDVRMTLTPGARVWDAVHHFMGACPIDFDLLYWQLNVQFHEIDWRRDRRFLSHWFASAYNPQVTDLVNAWVDALTSQGRLHGIVPFAQLTHDILTGARVDHVRCGAGKRMWAIDTTGALFPCPVMRGGRDLSQGSIKSVEPATLAGRFALTSPCDTCGIFGLCGGRCLCANLQKRWGEEGFALVCASVKHLVTELERVAPRVQKAVDDGIITLDDLAIGRDYEVIP